jgi:hypothetical protein
MKVVVLQHWGTPFWPVAVSYYEYLWFSLLEIAPFAWQEESKQQQQCQQLMLCGDSADNFGTTILAQQP